MDNRNKIEAPLYWHKIDGEWFYYTMNGLQKVNLEAVVTHVNFYEASAFAEWKKMLLPDGIELGNLLPNQFDRGENAGNRQRLAYLPYPNFKNEKAQLANTTGNFYVNRVRFCAVQAATSPNHSRKTYRSFFHADERWQFDRHSFSKIKNHENYYSNIQSRFCRRRSERLDRQEKQSFIPIFLDDKGSHIFQQTLKMPEYYPADCEFEILSEQSEEILEQLNFEGKFNIRGIRLSGDGSKDKAITENFFRQKC